MDFPIIGTKNQTTTSFNLVDPTTRADYFQDKVSSEIKTINDFLQDKNFTAFMIGKKNSGKGTYAKLFAEALQSDKIIHLSVGDLVRETHASWDSFINSADGQKLKSYYQAETPFDEAVEAFLGRSASKLLPTEFIVALLRVRLDKHQGLSVFVDGFPREEAQIPYAKKMKDLVGRPDDKVFFVLIDIPDSVIDERIKYRVICPICNVPRNLKLLTTKNVGYDPKTKEFYLLCDEHNVRMVTKEGDDLGIKPIEERLKKEQQILEQVYNLPDVDKVLLRNSIPIDQTAKYFDNYEVTPAYSYQVSQDQQTVKTIESPWIIKDNSGVESNSLLPMPVVASMIKQVARILNK